MNVYLHGIGGDKVVVHSGHDSLAAPWGKEYTMILANPPFGKSQSVLFVNEEGDMDQGDAVVVREDFWTETSNKQLNFVQHMFTLIKINGAPRGGATGAATLTMKSSIVTNSASTCFGARTRV